MKAVALKPEFQLSIEGDNIILSGPAGIACAPFIDSIADIISCFRRKDRWSYNEEHGRHSYLEWLHKCCAVTRIVSYQNKDVLAIEPLSEHYQLPRQHEVLPDVKVRLSKFAFLRVLNVSFVVESPLAYSRIAVMDARALCVIGALASSVSAADIQFDFPDMSLDFITSILSALAEERYLEFGALTVHKNTENNIGSFPGNGEALHHWEFHDLLFHSRSRMGRYDGRFGGTFRFRGIYKALPATKAYASDGGIIKLDGYQGIQSLQEVAVQDIVEKRSSVRKVSSQPIKLSQLGQFLFRTARVRNRYVVDDTEMTSRPYPNGGASYELEIYPVVYQCAGLQPGLYHYDALRHALEPLAPPNYFTQRLQCGANVFTGKAAIPDVVFVISARFRRVSYKYESIAYATILKNVGALYQTMYIVATSMNLSPCALGAGDADDFSDAIFSNYYEETSVGEFILSG